ncbi:unnamed protein product [Camellia sinensis]
MQCANACWVSSAQVPLIRASKWEANKPSIAQTRTNQPLGNPPNSYCDDGDGDDDDSGGSSSSSSSSWVVGFPLAGDVKFISSTSNPFVKHCLKLRLSSSYRHSHASALVVGSTPIREIYRFQESKQERPATIDCLLVLDKAKIPDGLDDRRIRIVRVSSMVMKKLSGLQSTESVEAIALLKIPSTFHNLDDNWQEADCHGWFPSPHRILVLDGIQDPGNVGTLLRSALAFKWGGAFLLPGCCDPFNEKALRASRGASFQLPIVSGTWTHLEALRNKFHLKILAGHPESNEQSKPVSRLSQGLADSLANLPLCLVLGGEGSGLSAKTRQNAHEISVLCDADIGLIIFSAKGKLFEYSTTSCLERILERYERYSYAERQLVAADINSQVRWTLEHVKLQARLEVLDRTQRHFMGEDLDTLSVKELQSLEHQLDSALKHIRSRKNQLMNDSISELQTKDKALLEENKLLAKKIKEKEGKALAQHAQLEQQNQDPAQIR